VTANLLTPVKVEQAVTAKSTIHHDGSYVAPATININGLYVTLSKTGLVKETHRKHELLHFAYVAEWESYRAVFVFRQFFLHEDTSLPMQLFVAGFKTFDYGQVWMSIQGCINQMYGKTPTDLRMGVPVHVTNFDGLSVTLT
jgi:hypothetical protein